MTAQVGRNVTACEGPVRPPSRAAVCLVALLAATIGLLLMLAVRAMHPPAAATGLIFALHPVPPHIAVPLLIAGAAGVAMLGELMRRSDREPR